MNVKIITESEIPGHSYMYPDSFEFILSEINDRDMKHEVVHEVQYNANTRLCQWVLWKNHLSKKYIT